MTASGKLDACKWNPQQFIELIAEVIRRRKRLALVDGIEYQKVGDEVFYAQRAIQQGRVERPSQEHVHGQAYLADVAANVCITGRALPRGPFLESSGARPSIRCRNVPPDLESVTARDSKVAGNNGIFTFVEFSWHCS